LEIREMAKKKKYTVTIGEDTYNDLEDPDVEHEIIDRMSGPQKVTIVTDGETRIAEYPGHKEFKIQIQE